MNRNPPTNVKRTLRSEVGFGCPVPDCGSPYLEWHHFDPPFSVENHHDPERMIALCREHHIQADNGAWTIDQLYEMKRSGRRSSESVKGKFQWMRNQLIAIVGGNFYFETPIIFQYKNEPIIWFNRDKDGYLLLNLRMLTASGEPRAELTDNNWGITGLEEDVESPPSAKRIIIKYANGDYLSIRFFELKSFEEAKRKYLGTAFPHENFEYPITAVEIQNTVAGTGLAFTETDTQFGTSQITGCFIAHGEAGLVIE